MGNITLGQYFPMESPMHRMDPRTKLVASLAYLVVIFIVHTWIGYVAAAALIIAGTLFSRVPVKFVIKGIKPLWFIILLTFVLNVFFHDGETVLWEWRKVVITTEALIFAAEIAIRLILLVEATTLLTLTTSPMEITSAMESLLSPLKVIKFPVHELSLMMSIALRFIPTLMDETDRLMKAQTARGANFDTGGIFARAKAMITILVPLFVSAFKRADELALAMESRCYNGGTGRTRYKTLKFAWRDLVFAIVIALFITLVALGF